MPMFVAVMMGMAVIVCMLMRRPMAVHMHHRLCGRCVDMRVFMAVPVAQVVGNLAVLAAVAGQLGVGHARAQVGHALLQQGKDFFLKPEVRGLAKRTCGYCWRR